MLCPCTQLLGFLLSAALAFATFTLGMGLGFTTALAFTTFAFTFGFLHLAATFTLAAAAFGGFLGRSQAVATAQFLSGKRVAGGLYAKGSAAQQGRAQGRHNGIQMLHGESPVQLKMEPKWPLNPIEWLSGVALQWDEKNL
jgi:hypothetical protein